VQIYPKMVAAIGIRVLASGNYDVIMNTFGISKAGFYYTRNKLIVPSWTYVFLLLLRNGKRRVKASL
jgi:hypothetical protein